MNNNLAILNDIELEFAEQDTRGQYRAKLNWKILFREVDEEWYNKRVKEINSFFENKNIVIEKETWLPYKINENKNLNIYIDFILNKIFTGKEEYLISSKYLESPIGKAKYTSWSYKLNKEDFEKINLTENEQLKINFLEKLTDIENFDFTQDVYFEELVYAYKILLDQIDFEKIQVTNDDSMIVEDGTHKTIALVELLKEWKTMNYYSLNNLKNKIKSFLINTKIIESKMLEWHFKFSDMKILDYSEIDELPSNDRVKNIIEWHKGLM